MKADFARTAGRWVTHGRLALTLVLFLVACGSPDPTATPTATQPPTATPTLAPGATATPTPTADPFVAEWEALIAAASAEGHLVVDGRLSAMSELRPVFDLFAEKFGVEVTVAGSDRETANRVLAEQQAGIFGVDSLFNTVTDSNQLMIPGGTIVPLKPLFIHPEILNLDLWLQGRHWWVDPGQEYLFSYAANASNSTFGDMYVNTDLVNADNIKNRDAFTYWDILDPEQPWAGKLASMPPTRGTGRWARTLKVDGLGEEFIRTVMASPAITWQNEDRLIVDGIVAGTYAMTFNTTGSTRRNILALRDRGAPIAILWDLATLDQVGIVTGGGSGTFIQVPRNQPNPNAAKLWLNWLPSREGQTARHELIVADFPAPTLRIDDIPFGNTLESERINPDGEYLFLFGSAEQEAETALGRVFVADLWECVRLTGPEGC